MSEETSTTLCACGNSGVLRTDPYVAELSGREVDVILCDDCYEQALLDI